MKSGELFAGVGGLGMAVDEVFGAEPAWFCEFDAAPSKVLAHRFPDVPNFGDVRSVDWASTERVQVIAGGFPCQDVSLAGRRRGMKDGTRSGLWSEFAKAIDEIRPDWVVIENVRGLLSADAAGYVEPCPLCVGDNPGHVLRALGAVLGDLAELGFDAEWTGIRATDVGAPHGRFRVFILAWPTERTLADAGSGRGWGRAVAPGRGSGTRADASAHGADTRYDRTPESASVTLLPTPVAQPSGNTPEDHLRKKPGREVVTDLAIIAENGLIETGGRLLPTPTASEGKKGGPNQAYGSGGTTLSGTVPHLTDWGPYEAAIRRWETIIGRSTPAPVRYDGKGGKARLNPELTEWMMGWPAGWVTNPELGLSRAEQLKACGNGVVPQQAAAALREMLAHPGVPPLTDRAAA